MERKLSYFQKNYFSIMTIFFLSNDGEKMIHGAIGSTLTTSFDEASVFNKQEYARFSPTMIRCA